MAYLDALTAIEIAADANASDGYYPELLDRWGVMGDDDHRQRLLITALILVGARLDLMCQRQADQDPLKLIRAAVCLPYQRRINDHDHTVGGSR